MKHFLLFTLLLIFNPLFAQEQNSDPSPIIFIFDASGSMWGEMQGKTKIEIARKVLSESVEKLPEEQHIGLVAYGHRTKGDCKDVAFLVDTDAKQKNAVVDALTGIKPLGKTPLAYSAELVIDDLRKKQAKATIILITDGIESCDGDLCEVVKKAKAEGIDFRLHIIGFGLKEGEAEALKCAAKEGEGKYFPADNADELSDVINTTTEETVDEPAGTFSVYAIKNGEPIDAWFRAYKVGTKDEIDVTRTYGDTSLLALPAGKYDIEVRALGGSDVVPIYLYGEESFSDSIVHKTVSFDAGTIEVSTSNNMEGWDATVKIIPHGAPANTRSVSGGRTYGRPTKYEVNPGVYDVYVKALRIKGSVIEHKIEQVTVIGGETVPAKHDFKSGIAKIGVKTATELVDATVNFKDLETGKSVAGSRTYTSESSNPKEFILTPGNYEVKINTLGKHKGTSKVFKIEVKTGATVEKIIQI